MQLCRIEFSVILLCFPGIPCRQDSPSSLPPISAEDRHDLEQQTLERSWRTWTKLTHVWPNVCRILPSKFATNRSPKTQGQPCVAQLVGFINIKRQSTIDPRYWYMISADPSALPEGEAQGKREALTALPACQLGPVRAPPHLWPARACSHGSVHRPPPLACCRFARVLEWLVPHDAAQGRYVNPTNACQSFQPHPSAFNAFSGFEGAKWHRLCRPSGNPLGLNPAGVLPFRMRAHRRRQPNQCLPKLPAPPIHLCF